MAKNKLPSLDKQRSFNTSGLCRGWAAYHPYRDMDATISLFGFPAQSLHRREPTV